MAKYGSRADSEGRNRYEIIAQAHLVERNLTKLSIQLDIPPRTLSRIVAERKFELIFKKLKLRVMDDARLKLRNMVDPAIDTVFEIMNDKFVAPAVRLAAACKVIEYGHDAYTVERFADRLEKLEAKTINAIDSGVIANGPETNNGTNDGWIQNTPDWKDQSTNQFASSTLTEPQDWPQ